jgi:hypothetical protein
MNPRDLMLVLNVEHRNASISASVAASRLITCASRPRQVRRDRIKIATPCACTEARISEALAAMSAQTSLG